MTRQNDGYSIEYASSIVQMETWRRPWQDWQWHPNADIDFYLLILEVWKAWVEPLTIVVLDQGRPVMLCAGRIEKAEEPFQLGYWNLFRCKVRRLNIITGGYMGQTSGTPARVAIRAIQEILKQRRLDYALICDVPKDSDLHRYALEQTSFLCRDHAGATTKHWRLRLPGSYDEFLKQRKKSQRQWMKRMARPLERDFPGRVQVRVFQAESEVGVFCTDAEQVARLTYHRSLGAGFVNDDLHRRRCLLTARRGSFRGFVLYVDDVPRAFWAGTVYGNCMHLAWTAYHPDWRKYELGTVLFLKMVERLCQEKIPELDFGLGDAPYKERFCDRCWEEASVSIYSPTVRGVAINCFRTILGLASRAARAVLGSLGLVARLKTHWRRRLTRKGPEPESA